MKKLTTLEFVERLQKIFGDKYDFSKTVYNGSKNKVTVICKEHGEFQAQANHLLEGHGCPACVNRYVTTEDYIKKAKAVHNDEYDYSQVTYTNNHTPIAIICRKHGVFMQNPYMHLQGCGCPRCNGGVASTKEEFEEKANKIHHNYYDYSEFVYKSAKTKGKIICPKHGAFMQMPYAHLEGKGCPKCKSSKLENIMLNALQKSDIRFVFQAHIGSLGKKTIDFYLPDYKIAIECQGEQHFIDTKFGSNVALAEDRIKKDNEKYGECSKCGIELIYFTIPSFFHEKDISIDIPFYQDKRLYTQIDDVMNYIKEHEFTLYTDKWDDLRKVIFEAIPNTIETNHGFIWKNRMVFLYDSQYDNITISEWRKYYNNRHIIVKFVDYSSLGSLEEIIQWLNNPLKL